MLRKMMIKKILLKRLFITNLDWAENSETRTAWFILLYGKEIDVFHSGGTLYLNSDWKNDQGIISEAVSFP
jgi:hypothetical protein